jgi:hypothetical protein
MKIQGYQCDECGVQKKESNHWVIAYNYVPAMIFQPWDNEQADKEGVLTLCGEGCAAKVLSKQIASWKLQPREEA